ncbi:nitrate reductase [Prolixibacteraceae bacterium JC049]|nr:nitrate reductase [Prolixibacteraceae bacterium JC049]
MNISGVVVRVKTEYAEQIKQQLIEADFCEFHLHQDSVLIVTIEAADIKEEIKKLDQIKNIEHVASAEIAYSFCEEELEREKEVMLQNEQLPNYMNDDNFDIKTIKYGGDIRNL